MEYRRRPDGRWLRDSIEMRIAVAFKLWQRWWFINVENGKEKRTQNIRPILEQHKNF